MRRGSWYVPGNWSMASNTKTPGWAWAVVAGSAQQSQSTNDWVPGAIYRGEWGHYSRATPGHHSRALQGNATSWSGHGNGQCQWQMKAKAMKNTQDSLPLSLKVPSLPLLLSWAHLLPLFTMTYNLPLGTSPNQRKWQCSWDEFKPKEACKCKVYELRQHRGRPTLRMTRPWRRLTSRSTRWKYRRGSNVKTWVRKSGLRMSSRNSAVCLKHPWWRRRHRFGWKLPKGDSSITNQLMKSPSRALPITYRWWARSLARPHLLLFCNLLLVCSPLRMQLYPCPYLSISHQCQSRAWKYPTILAVSSLQYYRQLSWATQAP